MNPALILQLIGPISTLLAGLLHELDLARQKGEITPEQLAQVKADLKIADDEYDQAIADARARLAAGGQPVNTPTPPNP